MPTTRSQPLPRGALWLDRRKADRIQIAVPLSYRLLMPGRQMQGCTFSANLSGKGVRFVVPWPVAPGTACELRLLLPDDPSAVRLNGQVVRCRAQRDGTSDSGLFELGVAIVASRTTKDAEFARFCQFVACRILERHLKMR
ncbi:MAG: PilZ domain-containing protein [Candidatus Omnitrophica bacterium]|nr:PilZ domain-containing protein [Candidatus Omnitrophota bacterium]